MICGRLLIVSDKSLRLKDGTRVPGATTVIGLLDKPFLVPWANRLGFKGIDSTEYTNKAAKRGTLIHTVLESHVLNEEVEIDMSQYTESEISNAVEHLNYYKEWEAKHKVEPIWCEHPLVSETYKFGGYVDFYAKVDDKYTVIDFKTSKRINEEYFLQLSSYVVLFEENDLPVDQIMVLNVGKNPEDKFIEANKSIDETRNYFKLFKALLDVYWIKKEIDFK